MSATLSRIPTSTAPPAGADVIASISATVTDILSIIADRRVEPADNVFDLGFTALDAVVACVRLSAAVGVRLPVATVFENPTVPQLVETLIAYTGVTGPPGPVSG